MSATFPLCLTTVALPWLCEVSGSTLSTSPCWYTVFTSISKEVLTVQALSFKRLVFSKLTQFAFLHWEHKDSNTNEDCCKDSCNDSNSASILDSHFLGELHSLFKVNTLVQVVSEVTQFKAHSNKMNNRNDQTSSIQWVEFLHICIVITDQQSQRQVMQNDLLSHSHIEISCLDVVQGN